MASDVTVEEMGEPTKRKSFFKRIKKCMHWKRSKKKKCKDADSFEYENTEMRSKTMTVDQIPLGNDLGSQKNITFNCNGTYNVYIGEGRHMHCLSCSQNMQSEGSSSQNRNSEEVFSVEESSVGSSGSTQVEISGLINGYESSEESDGPDNDYKNDCGKSKYEFYVDYKRALKTDLEKVRNDIVCLTHAKKSCTDDKHMDRCDSGTAISYQEKRCKTWGSKDFEQIKQDVLHSSDSGYIPSGPDGNEFYEQSEFKLDTHRHQTLLESEERSEHLASAQKWNDLNRESNVGLSIESNLNLTTFGSDMTNVKPYSGQPELDPPQQMEELTENSHTTPKEQENSMHLQKVIDNMPLPDPVATHEETQLKLNVTADSDDKSFPYEVSSGYPDHTCSSKTEEVLAGWSLVSLDSEWLKNDDTQFNSDLNVNECGVGVCVELSCTSANSGQESDQLRSTESNKSNVASIASRRDIRKEQEYLQASVPASLKIGATEVDTGKDFVEKLCSSADDITPDISAENKSQEGENEEAVLSDEVITETEQERNPADRDTNVAKIHAATVDDVSLGSSHTEKLQDKPEATNEDFCGHINSDNGGPDVGQQYGMQIVIDESMHDNVMTISDSKDNNIVEEDMSKSNEAPNEHSPAHNQATKHSAFEKADTPNAHATTDIEKDMFDKPLLFSEYLETFHDGEGKTKPSQADVKEPADENDCDKINICTCSVTVTNDTGRSVEDEPTNIDHTELDPHYGIDKIKFDQSIEGKFLGHTSAEVDISEKCPVHEKDSLSCSDKCIINSPPIEHSDLKKMPGLKKRKKRGRKNKGKSRKCDISLESIKDRETQTRNVYVTSIQLKKKLSGNQISGDYVNQDKTEHLDSDLNDIDTGLNEGSWHRDIKKVSIGVKKKRRGRNNYFCSSCHRIRKKPNNQCPNHMYDPLLRPFQELVRCSEHGNSKSDQAGTESVFGETSTGFDSGVFSEFVSQVSSYTSSYDSLKKLFKTCHETGKEAKARTRKHDQKMLMRSNRVTSLISHETDLRKFLRQITSSWSYFGPESYSPYLYPGLASYFDRTRDGNELSDRERYSYEWIRFQSFDQYRGNGSGIVLARNGFYHDRNAGPTATRCYACGATYSDWQFFDDSGSHHRSDCPLHTGINTGNIPIQHDGDNDMHAPAVGIVREAEPGNNDGSATSEASCTNATTVSTNVADTAQTRATSSSLSVDMLAASLEQARIGSQNGERTSMQPTQDRENEQYMSSFAAHRDNTADSLSTSQSSQSRNRSPQNVQSSEAANALSNRDTGSPQRLPHLGHAGFGHGAMGGTPSGAVNDPTPLSQPVTVSSPTAPSQLAASGQPLAGALSTQGIQASAEARPRYLETPGNIQLHPELIHVDSPKHPEYATVEARADTFRGAWPATLDQTPRRMAEAGFFFTGVADFTRCFACGGGLRNWEAGDDPVIEHTRWYPTCPYINKLKGEKYVQAVTKKQQQHLEEKRKQQQNLAQQQAAQQRPPDPMRTGAASILVEMGYPQDKIKDAILAVRRQTGKVEVTGEQALIWILDDEERRNIIAARRAEGSAAFASSPTSPAVEASSSSTSSTSSAATTAATATSSTSTQPQSHTTGSQTPTAGSQQPTGSQPSGAAQSQPSESARNQQGATGGGSGNERGESPKPSGGKSKKKRKKRGGQPASLPAEGASGNSGDLAPPAATQSLREENEKLRDIQTCKICLDKPVDTTFLPCGHLVCCSNCAHKLRKCPICRKLIKGSVKTFMS